MSFSTAQRSRRALLHSLIACIILPQLPARCPPTLSPSPPFCPQIPCAGHGEVPQPSAVSDLCCEMYLYLQRCPQGMALIHCTHGFNRTGYMIASYLARTKGLNIPKALRTFAEHRPPGIYKQFYVRCVAWL